MTRDAVVTGEQTSQFEYSLQLSKPDASNPLTGIYGGYFYLQIPGESALKITEKDMTLEFTPNSIGTLNVRGQGQNCYGKFSVSGTCALDGRDLELARVYVTNAPSRPSAPIPAVRKPSGKDLNRTTPLAEQSSAQQSWTAVAYDLEGKRQGRTRKVPSHLRDGSVPSYHQASHATSEALKRCLSIVTSLARSAGASWFSAPVDVARLGIPHYQTIIDAPMDLNSIKCNLDRGLYTNVHAFTADLRLVFHNALTFNVLPEAPVHEAARDLHMKLEDQLKSLWRYLAGATARSKIGVKRNVEEDVEVAGGKRCKILTARATRKDGKKGPRNDDVRTFSAGASMVPVADLVSMQRQMESMQATIAALQKQASQTEVQVQMNMELGLTPSGYSLSKFPDNNVKPLTFDEKETLSNDINALPPDKLAHVVKLVQESMPLAGRHSDDEIEVDIEALDNETLHKLQKYVKISLGKNKFGKLQPYCPASSESALPPALSSDTRTLESVAFGGSGLGPGFNSDEDENDLDYEVLEA